MLLVIDVGNTNTVLGIYEGERLLDNWRLWTERDRTSDEYEILVRNLFSSRSISAAAIEAIAISCVVPPMLGMLLELSQKYFTCQMNCFAEAIYDFATLSALLTTAHKKP